MLTREQYINFGSSRITFDNDDGYVIKYPLSYMGLKANQVEYQNYLMNKDIVAKTILLNNGLLLQEKLTDCYEFSLEEVRSGKIEKMLIEKYGEEGKKFFNHIFIKKLCIGKNSKGKLLQYDYENIKGDFPQEYLEKEPHLIFNENLVDDFIQFINSLDEQDINKKFYKEEKIKRE